MKFHITLVSTPIVSKTRKLKSKWTFKEQSYTHIRRHLRKGNKLVLQTLIGEMLFAVKYVRNGWAHLRSGDMCVDLKRVGKKCWKYNHHSYSSKCIKLLKKSIASYEEQWQSAILKSS